MNVFFDVDYTLITWDYRLRPHVREVFARLRADGHTIYLWSGMGRRWEVVQQFELHEYVTDCFDKPLYNHVARLEELGVNVYPDYVIDDHADPVRVFGGYHIPEPRSPLEADAEMLRVYEAIRAHAEGSHMMKEHLAFEVCTTPYGDMVAAATAAGICRLLPPGETLDSLFAWAARQMPGVEPMHRPGAAGDLQVQLDAYFAGALHDFALPLDLRGTPFQRAVWQEVCAIPYGETRSYAEIARAVGKPAAARAVGAANAINPVCLVIPCHRVIGADGTLKGYAGGVLNRRILLGLEQGPARTTRISWRD